MRSYHRQVDPEREQMRAERATRKPWLVIGDYPDGNERAVAQYRTEEEANQARERMEGDPMCVPEGTELRVEPRNDRNTNDSNE